MFIPTKKPKVRTRPPLEKLLTNKPLHWTEHAKYKMKQYGLSAARVKRVLRFPVRTEAGIAPKTVAVMQPNARDQVTKKGDLVTKPRWTQELWVMYEDTKKERKVIAAWRYPGVSPVREPPPFPEDLMG